MHTVKLLFISILSLLLICGCGEEEEQPADLFVESITFDGKATVGQPIFYTVTIGNVGEGTAGNVKVTTYIGTTPNDFTRAIDQYTIPELRPGDIHTQTLSFVPMEDYLLYIIAKVDDDDRIAETREDNNLQTSQLQFHYREKEVEEETAVEEDGQFADIAAADLWYPGGVGSRWVYNTPSSERVTTRVVENMEIGGKIYKAVRESEPLMSIMIDEPDPFLTFKKAEPDRILGYGKAANELFKEIFLDSFVEMGFDKANVSVQSVIDEWVILENLIEGHKWTVMKLSAILSFMGITVRGTIQIQGEILRMERTETIAGEFETFVIDYTMASEVEGEAEEQSLCTLWLSPNVGLIQLELDGDIAGSLIEYEITRAKPAPVSYHKFLPNVGHMGTLKPKGLLLRRMIQYLQQTEMMYKYKYLPSAMEIMRSN